MSPTTASTAPSSPMKTDPQFEAFPTKKNVQQPQQKKKKRVFLTPTPKQEQTRRDTTEQPTETQTDERDEVHPVEEATPVGPPIVPKHTIPAPSYTEAIAGLGIERIQTMPVAFVFENALVSRSAANSHLLPLASESMQNTLEQRFKNHASSAATTIHIQFIQCSEGDRSLRMWCGEFGMGWVVLEVKWFLTQNDKPVVNVKRIKLRDSAAIGLRDLGDFNYGQRALLHDLCVRAAEQIKNQATHFFLQTEKF